jgi:3-hydroxy-3-methylglutaryl CoA synthase
MIGVTAYGGYIPRLRMPREAVSQAIAWYAPQFTNQKGSRAFANWDEDSVTMAVAAACLTGAEFKEAYAAVATKRAPDFTSARTSTTT